eukprot:COSAG01_NODE_4238_length_5213_cov_59.185960_5_plen_75_part_00
MAPLGPMKHRLLRRDTDPHVMDRGEIDRNKKVSTAKVHRLVEPLCDVARRTSPMSTAHAACFPKGIDYRIIIDQ